MILKSGSRQLVREEIARIVAEAKNGGLTLRAGYHADYWRSVR